MGIWPRLALWTAVGCAFGAIHMAVGEWAISRWFTPDHITLHDAIRDGLRFAVIAYAVLMVGAALLQAVGIPPVDDD